MSTKSAVEPHTSDRIFDAAVSLFHRQGYNATSLRQIADAVGLQVGSLYNHLASKEDLLFTIMRQVMEELIDHMEGALADAGPDPVDRVRAFLQASVSFHATRREQTFIGNTELRGLSDQHRTEVIALRDTYEALFRDALAEAQDSGAIDVEDVQLATYCALAMCSSVATWYNPQGRLTLNDIETMLPELFGPLAAHDD